MFSFDFALSLGSSCRAKRQIVRLFGRGRCPSGPFDWRLTPAEAVATCLDRDFRNTFALPDLVVVDGEVRHRGLNMVFPHEFPRDATRWQIIREYLKASSKHRYRCHKARSLLRGDAPLLLVTANPAAQDLAVLEAALRRYNPRLKYTLVPVHDSHLPPTHPAPDDWTGNDAAWDRALEGFRLTHHERT
jgi:hypothetical protein